MLDETSLPLKISVVATLLDEEESVAGLLDSLAGQTLRPCEVIFVDGGSKDRTVELLREAHGRLPIQVLELPGSNIAEGRNAAIAHASGDLIAVTDGGVRLRPDWLEELARPFDRGRGKVDVVSGFFEAAPQTVFELAMGATVLPDRDDINPARFLPSSRSVAFTREAWRKAGGYPEWLDYCEDVVFDLALRRANLVFAWAPDAVALFRPRRDLESFWSQYFRYARGDGKAGLWPARHAVRYASYLAAVDLLLHARRRRIALVPLLLGAAAHLWAPYRRLLSRLTGLGPRDRMEAMAWVPVIRVVGDIAKMAGYPAGVVWRIRHRLAFR